jgi:hypothetical protein
LKHFITETLYNIADDLENNLKKLKNFHQSLNLNNELESRVYDSLNDVISGLTIRIKQAKFIHEKEIENYISYERNIL